MNEYRYDFDVKYLLVEKDLKSKVQGEDQVYDIQDIENICLELYKVDLLKVFRLNHYDEQEILSKIDRVILIIKKEESFREILNHLKNKIYNSEYQSNLNLFLFSYDLFYYFHNYIKYYIIHKRVDIESKNELIKNINLII